MGLKRFAFTLLIALAPSSAITAPDKFSGSTPCGPEARAFLGISADAKCERITWQLGLRPGAFEFDATSGMQAVNAPGFAAGARQTRLRGTWTKGGRLVSYARSEVYTLVAESGRTLPLALIDGTLLHFLTSDSRLLPGDGGWSYTLAPAPGAANPPVRRLTPLSRPLPEWAGDFEGRTPCLEISRLLDLAPAPDCAKLKWGVTFFPDGTYKIEGTLYRAAPRRGDWTLRRDEATGEVIYVLDAGAARRTLALLRVDADVLFFLDERGAVLQGNTAHAYTLNRSARAVIALSPDQSPTSRAHTSR